MHHVAMTLTPRHRLTGAGKGSDERSRNSTNPKKASYAPGVWGQLRIFDKSGTEHMWPRRLPPRGVREGEQTLKPGLPPGDSDRAFLFLPVVGLHPSGSPEGERPSHSGGAAEDRQRPGGVCRGHCLEEHGVGREEQRVNW